MTEDITAGELARRMNDVLRQFQSLVDQVETRYIRKDYIDLYKQNIDSTVDGIKRSMTDLEASKADKTELEAVKADVAELKDNNKWLFRLVVGFIVLAILGAVFTVGGGVGK